MTEAAINLKQAMDKAMELPQGAPPESSDVEKLIATGNRMLRVQQGRLTTARANHERMRTDRINWYRGEMQRIADDAEHELLMLDHAWAETERKMLIVIGKLKAMRGA